MLRLEKRPTPSRFWLYATPPAAVILTMIAGGTLFAAMGKAPLEVIRTIFWDPIFGEFAFYLRGQLLVKNLPAAPLRGYPTGGPLKLPHATWPRPVTK